MGLPSALDFHARMELEAVPYYFSALPYFCDHINKIISALRKREEMRGTLISSHMMI